MYIQGEIIVNIKTSERISNVVNVGVPTGPLFLKELGELMGMKLKTETISFIKRQ
jgi:hypothetical protein